MTPLRDPTFIMFIDVFPFRILLSTTCREGSLSSTSVFGFPTPFGPHCVQSPLSVRLQTCVYHCICMCECARSWRRVCVSACLTGPPVEVTLPGVWGKSSGGLLEFTRWLKNIWKIRTIYLRTWSTLTVRCDPALASISLVTHDSESNNAF